MNNLINQYKNGNIELFDDILKKYNGVIYNVISQFNIHGFDREDLYQEACITLIKALDNYDDSKGIKFSNFLALMIKNRLINIAKEKSVVHHKKYLSEYMSDANEDNSIEDMIIHKGDVIERLSHVYQDLTERDKIIIDTLFTNYDISEVSNKIGLSEKSFRNYRSKLSKRIEAIYMEA